MKRVWLAPDPDGERTLLASFQLEGDRVVCTWKSDALRAEIESDGLPALVDGAIATIRPRDGRTFYDALATAYDNSSRVVVTTDPD